MQVCMTFVLYSPDGMLPPIRVCVVVTSRPGKGFEGVSAKNCFIKKTLFKNRLLALFILITVFVNMRILVCRGMKWILFYPLFVGVSLRLLSLSFFERCERSFDLWRLDLTLYKIPSLYENAWPIFPRRNCDLALVSWTDIHKHPRRHKTSIWVFLL